MVTPPTARGNGGDVVVLGNGCGRRRSCPRPRWVDREAVARRSAHGLQPGVVGSAQVTDRVEVSTAVDHRLDEPPLILETMVLRDGNGAEIGLSSKEIAALAAHDGMVTEVRALSGCVPEWAQPHWYAGASM